MATASRARLVLAAVLVGGAAAVMLAPGGNAQVLPPLPTPPAIPTPTPTAIAGPNVPSTVPVPPQAPLSNPPAGEPSVPAPACSLPPLKPFELRTVADLTPTPSWWWGESLAVDPANPCHLYTTANTTNGAGFPVTVFRGDVTSSGTSWNPVFTVPLEPEDPVPSASDARVAPTWQNAPMVGPDGTVWLAASGPTQARLTRVFRSQDAGWHWAERDTGFGTQDPSADYSVTAVAPSDPHTVYVVTVPRGSGPSLLHVTHDDGQTWSTTLLPEPVSYISGLSAAPLIVDPLDARTLYYEPHGSSVLWVSSDGGSSWSSRQATPLLPPGDVENSLAVHVPGRTPVLYVHVVNNTQPVPLSIPGFPLPNVCAAGHGQVLGITCPTATVPGVGSGSVPVLAVNGWYSTADLGTTWQPLNVPPDDGSGHVSAGTCYRPCPTGNVPTSFLAVDPTNPNVMVWSNGGSAQADRTLELLIFTNGPSGGPRQRVLIKAPPGASGVTAESLRTDARGDFFLALESCGPCPSLGGGVSASTVLAFRPSLTLSFQGTIVDNLGSSQLPPGDSGQLNANTPPVQEPVSASVSNCTVGAGTAGSIAFDGRYVDYTQDGTPAGTIFRFDAAACTQAPSLTLSAADFPSGSTPAILALTYDSRFAWPDGRAGALLGSAAPGFDSRIPVRSAPIYAIDPVTAHSLLLTSVNTTSAQCATGQTVVQTNGTVQTQACPDVSFFSYDVFRGSLWSLGTQPGGGGGRNSDPHPGFIAPLRADGTFHDNCLSAPGYTQSVAAAVVGGDGYLYVLWEDDTTILKMSADTCQIVSGFSMPISRPVSGTNVGLIQGSTGENSNEEEQIACDPLSYAAPVIWVRNSTVASVSAYPAPDANCPFVTRLTSSVPTTVLPGHSMTVCYTLEAALAGNWTRIPGQPVDVRVAGSEVGHPVTDQSGRACLTTPAPASFGGTTVSGAFAGTPGYLPVKASDVVIVPGGPGGSSNGPTGLLAGDVPPILPPGPPPAVGSGTQLQFNAGTETVAQAESQAQSQAQTQSVAQAQPGLVVQRRRQAQLATQEQQGAQTQVAYEATALRRGRPAPAGAVAAALMMLGGALALRRPRVAVSRATRGRRRPRG